MIENISEATILANKNANPVLKAALGITGRENRNGNDGTITRFGWKAQNKSLTMFSGEAYNVEMGVTNDLFQTERNMTPDCNFNTQPEDHVVYASDVPDGGGTSGMQHFATFGRLLAPPSPNGNEFRTAPLWGVGQRIFFLHDGRTSDLLQAIQDHASPGSEANLVMLTFQLLTESQKQDLLNFLRSL